MSQSFQALGVSAPVVRALGARNIHRPFAIQELVLPDALAGLDILAESPTGSGKTSPSACRSSSARPRPARSRPRSSSSPPVSSPSRSRPTFGRSRRPGSARRHRLRRRSVGPQAKRRARRTPRRDAGPAQRPPGAAAVKLDSVRTLVLDEADRMLDMGFKPQVDRILRTVPRIARRCSSRRRSTAASQSWRGRIPNASRFRAELPSDRRRDDRAHFVPVTPEGKLDRLVEQLNNAERGLALVFVRTKHGADKLARKLAREDVAAVAMHGNLSQNQRERALARFESGKVPTLVATDVAARGSTSTTSPT